jgi:hypothetical protein
VGIPGKTKTVGSRLCLQLAGNFRAVDLQALERRDSCKTTVARDNLTNPTYPNRDKGAAASRPSAGPCRPIGPSGCHEVTARQRNALSGFLKTQSHRQVSAINIPVACGAVVDYSEDTGLYKFHAHTVKNPHLQLQSFQSFHVSYSSSRGGQACSAPHPVTSQSKQWPVPHHTQTTRSTLLVGANESNFKSTGPRLRRSRFWPPSRARNSSPALPLLRVPLSRQQATSRLPSARLTWLPLWSPPFV